MSADSGPVRPIWMLLTVLAILLFARSPGLLMLEWILDPINATTVQAGSAAVQAFGAVVLLIVTGITLWETRRISRATERQSEATERQAVATTQAVELAQQQRRDLVRPVLHLGLRGLGVSEYPTTLSFQLVVLNVGLGPAFDVRVSFDEEQFKTEEYGSRADGATPALLGVNAAMWFDVIRSGAAVAQDWPGPGKENQIVGQILVTYRDSFDSGRATRADLFALSRPSRLYPYQLELRALRLDPPVLSARPIAR